MLDASTVNRCYPVTSISFNPKTQTAIVHRMNKEERKKSNLPSGNKKAIKYLSASSLKKLAIVAINTTTEFTSMATLTFLYPPFPSEAKKYLNRLIQFISRKLRRGLKFLWFMEFTRAGYVHFHILMDIPYQKELHTSIASFWANLIEPSNVPYSNRKTRREMMTQDSVLKVHSHPKTWENIRLKDGAKRYCLKYAMKPYQKKIPWWMEHPGRFWGTDWQTGKINWEEWETIPASEKDVRDYLWMLDHPTKKFDVIPKYLFNFPVLPK